MRCAFGSCACDGDIPGPANLTTADAIQSYAYEDSPSTVNPEKVRPEMEWTVPAWTLRLPHLWDTVRTLPQVVNVDYVASGCPPQPGRIEDMISAVMDIPKNGSPLPPRNV